MTLIFPYFVQPYEIMRAIERRDIMFIMEVRDRSFEVSAIPATLQFVRSPFSQSLIVKSGDVTPLIHAMRIEHTDMAIILLGAFSRYINNLQDEDVEKPETKKFLKMLRKRRFIPLDRRNFDICLGFNLKTAIDYGLQKQQKDLIASFLQTLIMSEGDSWVKLQTADVAVALREGTAGKPVHTAADAVRSFATKSLGQADFIASLED